MTDLRLLTSAVALSFALCSGNALAQAASAPAAAANPAKRELAKRWVTLQQSSLDNAARGIVENPARQLLGAAEPVLRNQVPADKREAVAKQLQDEVRKYVDEMTPVVRKRAQELAQTQMVAEVEQKYSEEELRQLIAFFESPVFAKLQQTQPPIEQALGRALITAVQPGLESKAKALQTTMAKILGVPPPAAAGAAASGPAGSGLRPAAPKPLGTGPATKP